MEKSIPKIDNTVSVVALQAAANFFDVDSVDLSVSAVGGGYSRNRRALVGYDDEWIFAKEVDKSLLPGDGSEEMSWLQKDYECVEALRSKVPGIVPEWSELVADGHVLLMSSYRESDGWVWNIPINVTTQHRYIDAVVAATKGLESIEFDTTTFEQLSLSPYFRDHLALDDGCVSILEDVSMRDQLRYKYLSMLEDKSLSHLQPAINTMLNLLDSDEKLVDISTSAARLIDQPNDCFGHCDVRSDNIAYNERIGELKIVDWNWASFTPRKFGSTEFLIDMARHGVDVSNWTGDLNPELLAASVGFYAKRCLREPLAIGSTLRDMQAESAAVSLFLYDKVRQQ